VRNGGVWTEQVKLTASDGVAYDYFGWFVSVSGDTAVVGASLFDPYGAGALYAYDVVPPASVNFDLAGHAVRIGGGALSQLVKVNTPALEPLIAPELGRLFDGWDSDFSAVTSDMTVTALYYDSTTSDGDSLWDGWEIKYLGGTAVSDGSIDTDGDGDSDEDEFISGTDPMDRADYFHVMKEAVTAVDGKITLRFRTNGDLGGRRYRILYTDDLISGSWTELALGGFAPDLGNFTEKTFDAPGAADSYFFKVEAFIQE